MPTLGHLLRGTLKSAHLAAATSSPTSGARLLMDAMPIIVLAHRVQDAQPCLVVGVSDSKETWSTCCGLSVIFTIGVAPVLVTPSTPTRPPVDRF